MGKKKRNVKRSNAFAHSTLYALILSAICMIAMAEISYNVSAKKTKELAEQNYAFFTGAKTETVTKWFLKEAAFLDAQVFSLEAWNNFDHDDLTEYMTAYVDSNRDPALFDFYFVDTENRMASGIHYDNVTEDPDFDYREREWYINAREHDGVQMSTAYVDKITDRMCVTLSEKVCTDGEFRGVLCIDVFVSSMFEIFTTEDMPDNSYSFIVDDKGGVIYHPCDRFVYTESPIPIYAAGLDGYDRIYTYLLTGKQGAAIVDYDGSERTFYFDRPNEYGWYVISAIDNSQVMREHDELRREYTIAAVIVGVIALILEIIMRFVGMVKANEEYDLVDSMAHLDQLTHLYNRRAYEEDLREYEEKGIPSKLCLLVFDMNGLKKMNDTQGHAAGDDIIKAVAKCLVETYASIGKVYRTGGDEFVVLLEASKTLLPDLHDQYNDRAAKWMRENFEGLSTAYGEAVHADYPELTIQELADVADVNMYRDKDRYYRESGFDRRRH